MALSKDGPIGYRHSLPKVTSPNRVVIVSRISPALLHGGGGGGGGRWNAMFMLPSLFLSPSVNKNALSGCGK